MGFFLLQPSSAPETSYPVLGSCGGFLTSKTMNHLRRYSDTKARRSHIRHIPHPSLFPYHSPRDWIWGFLARKIFIASDKGMPQLVLSRIPRTENRFWAMLWPSFGDTGGT